MAAPATVSVCDPRTLVNICLEGIPPPREDPENSSDAHTEMTSKGLLCRRTLKPSVLVMPLLYVCRREPIRESQLVMVLSTVLT